MVVIEKKIWTKVLIRLTDIIDAIIVQPVSHLSHTKDMSCEYQAWRISKADPERYRTHSRSSRRQIIETPPTKNFPGSCRPVRDRTNYHSGRRHSHIAGQSVWSGLRGARFSNRS